MLRLRLCMVWIYAVFLAQSSETAHIQREGGQATLIIESPRPVHSAAQTLAERFGIRASAEDPAYVFQDDVVEVTTEAASRSNPRKKLLIPKGGRLEVQFPVRPDGFPEDVRGMLEKLVEKANAQFPFAYRLDVDGDLFTLTPTRTRDALGRVVEATPLLDRRVTIPAGSRTVAETAGLMAAALSAQTGLRVSCCQGVVVGIPWGLTNVAFEAHEEPARSVLQRLIASDLQGRPNRYYWLLRCDPLPSGWCFIHVAYTARPAGVEAPGLPQPGERHLLRWFDPGAGAR
jgi:hypothetical protein